MTKAMITVKGMHCSSCSILIDESLEELAGVATATTDLRREITTVEYDPATVSLRQITAEITNLGYTTEAA